MEHPQLSAQDKLNLRVHFVDIAMKAILSDSTGVSPTYLAERSVSFANAVIRELSREG